MIKIHNDGKEMDAIVEVEAALKDVEIKEKVDKETRTASELYADDLPPEVEAFDQFLDRYITFLRVRGWGTLHKDKISALVWKQHPIFIGTRSLDDGTKVRKYRFKDICAETTKAIMMMIFYKAVWIPRSHITELSPDVIEITEWIAKKKWLGTC